MRIGAVGEGGPDQFGLVSAIEVDPEGNIFVAEYQSGEIRVFGPDGEFRFKVGGKGGGPGEFQALTGFTHDFRGNLWVQDTRLLRYSVFAPDGELRATHRIGLLPASLRPWPGRFHARDQLIEWAFQAPWPSRERRSDASSTPSAVARYFPVRVSFDPRTIDTLPPLREKMEFIDGTWAAKPFSGRLIFHLDHRGDLWFGDTKEYRIYRRKLSGDTTLAFSLASYEPRGVSRTEKERYSRSWIRPRIVPTEEIPDEKPVLEAIATDRDGYVYVFPNVEQAEGGTAVDVFRRSGVYLGRISLPMRLERRPVAPIVRDGHLYGLHKDELDVPYVVKMEVVRSPEE